MTTTNEHILKITGGASLPEAIDPSKTVKISTELEIYETSKRDNQDGTHNLIYKGKITSHVDITTGEKVLRSKDKGSQSKRTRGAIYALQNEVEKMDMDQELFYEKVQGIIRRHLPQIYEQFKSEI